MTPAAWPQHLWQLSFYLVAHAPRSQGRPSVFPVSSSSELIPYFIDLTMVERNDYSDKRLASLAASNTEAPNPFADLTMAKRNVDSDTRLASSPASRRPSSLTASNTETVTVTGDEWQALQKLLSNKLREYNQAKTTGNRAAKKKLAKGIEALMRALADSHNDPAVQAEWTSKADEFSKASDARKDNMLWDIGKGLGIVIASPFMLAGGILYGTGLFMKGMGNLLTAGAIGRTLNRGN
ncbi:hypothetical protein C8R45DRAFT_905963 [Mycena sanguinolenta]|nr:hypothetical protein C8R45DRAFT_905963 [Mycena sanguinolenta]